MVRLQVLTKLVALRSSDGVNIEPKSMFRPDRDWEFDDGMGLSYWSSFYLSVIGPDCAVIDKVIITISY